MTTSDVPRRKPHGCPLVAGRLGFRSPRGSTAPRPAGLEEFENTESSGGLSVEV